MESLLISKDFYKQKQCSCGGTLTVTYLKIGSNVMVKVKPKRNYYEIFVSNKLAVKGNGGQFETELNRYVG